MCSYIGYSFILTALCPILGNPTNGMVTLTGMSVGDTANSICNDGYELIGASVLTCQNDGTWDNTPPVCQSAGGKRITTEVGLTC